MLVIISGIRLIGITKEYWGNDMEKESKLYDSLIDYFIDKLSNGEVSDKELKVITDFVTEKGIDANPKTHEKTQTLSQALPFDELDEEADIQPLKRIK